MRIIEYFIRLEDVRKMHTNVKYTQHGGYTVLTTILHTHVVIANLTT